MKTFEENLTNSKSNQDYLKCKRDLNYIYDKKLEVIKIRRKCNWYEDGKIWIWKRNPAIQNQIRFLKISEKEVKV